MKSSSGKALARVKHALVSTASVSALGAFLSAPELLLRRLRELEIAIPQERITVVGRAVYLPNVLEIELREAAFEALLSGVEFRTVPVLALSLFYIKPCGFNVVRRVVVVADSSVPAFDEPGIEGIGDRRIVA